MVYPPATEVRETLNYGNGSLALRRKYDLTTAEVHELDRYGEVSERTRQWADDLRARLGGLSHA